MQTPIVGAKKQIAEVFNRSAETYERVGPKFFSHFGRHLVDFVVVTPGTRALDAASGRERIVPRAASRSASLLQASDFSQR